LVPIGDFDEDYSPSVEALDEFTRIYFDGMQVQSLPVLTPNPRPNNPNKLFVNVASLEREFDLRFRMVGKNKNKLQLMTSDVEDMLDELKRSLPNGMVIVVMLVGCFRLVY